MTHDPASRNEFEATPDEALGQLLREHLAPGNHADFTARVRLLVAAEPSTSWEVLARWARPGVAAAAGILLALTLLFGLAKPAPADMTLADAAQAAGVPSLLLADAPTTDAMLAAVVGDE